MMHQNQRHLKDLLDAQRKQQTELLNRLQSKDLHAFATMQANTNPSVSSDEPMYLRSDEAEAKRMVEMYGASAGVGDIILSDDDQEILDFLGGTRE